VWPNGPVEAFDIAVIEGEDCSPLAGGERENGGVGDTRSGPPRTVSGQDIPSVSPFVMASPPGAILPRRPGQ
jgi:hypothetical protein